MNQQELERKYVKELEQKYVEFRNHGATIDRETAHFSFHVESHPSFQAIMRMGNCTIAWMLQDLMDMNNEAPLWYWFIGLRKLTGVTPFKDSDRGRFDRIRKAWVQWGMDNRYLPRFQETKKHWWQFFKS